MSKELLGKVFGVLETPRNRKRIADIENEGGEVMKFSEPSVQRLDDEGSIVETVKKLADFDWIIFTDIHCVDVFAEILGENNIDPFDLDGLTVCAFGEAVADRLRFIQVHSDVIPSHVEIDVVYETVKNYLTDSDGLLGLKVLFFRSAGRDFEIMKRLRNEGAEIVEHEIYSTDGIGSGERTKFVTLLKGGAIDEFIFCSPEDVQSLVHLCDAESLSSVLAGIGVTATDSNTYQLLREHRLRSRLKV